MPATSSRPRRAALFPAALVLLTAALAGCLTGSAPLDAGSLGDGLGTPAYDTSRGWSVPLTPPLFEMLEPLKRFVPGFDGTEMGVGLFLPAVEGCDWDSRSLPEACPRLPAVMDAGPYYLDAVARDKFRPPTVEWLVPRGYAVLQMSLRGTGESGGCYEFKNPRDVDDISAVIDWIAAQPWSNGNVGMIGRSYDGTAAWSGAASGNPHLKAIVPISGAVDGPGLYYKNGTAEGRGPLQPAGYYPYYALGLAAGDPSYRIPEWVNNVCPAQVDDWIKGPLSTVTGDAGDPYWQARDLRGAILANYQGAAWVIHGMEDWNVNPSQAVPFVQAMQDAGIPTRAWLGQWAHAYPDRVDEHRNVRWDWAQQVLEWFDHWLKGEGPTPPIDVEVEDSLYVWRAEATYPPRDATWVELELAGGGALAQPGEGERGSFVLTGPPSGQVVGGAALAGRGGPQAVFTSEPLPEDLRVAGLPQLHVEVAPATPLGGQLFAELYDVFPDGRAVRLTWAAMDLRHHAGGNTEPRTLTPGQPVLALMEFEPADVHFGAGHRVRVVLHKAGVEDVMASPSPEPNTLTLGGAASLLRLPSIERPSVVPSYAPPVAGGG